MNLLIYLSHLYIIYKQILNCNKFKVQEVFSRKYADQAVFPKLVIAVLRLPAVVQQALYQTCIRR